MSPDFDEQLDTNQLTLLSYLWYAWGGLFLLGGCGTGALAAAGGLVGQIDDAQLQEGAAVWMGLAGCVTLSIVLWGALNAYVGRSHVTGRNRMLIYALAIFSLLSFPLGTALGAFTLVVLSRPGVQRRFA